MNKQFIKLGFALCSVSFLSLIGYCPRTLAETTSFFCDVKDGIPTTMAQTEGGSVPMISWKSDHFSSSGYTPHRRCLEVSEKFQKFYDNQTLEFLTTGKMNGQNVVCIASAIGRDCSELLFTLRPGKNPGKTLRTLMGVRDRNSGPLNETYARVYLDMDDYLESKLNATDKHNESAMNFNNTESSVKSKPLW